MQTTTSYLGIRLDHPFIAGASPLGYRVDTVKRLEDAGCAAVVLHSLFEEQITADRDGRIHHMDAADPQFAAAARLNGGVSLLLWSAIIVAGRLTANNWFN